jgi:uncharacterized membrane protein
MKRLTKAIGLSILSVFILSACDQVTNGPQQKTVKGAGIGAATGAVAGAVLGDDKQDIILGTAVGAVIGGIVGNTSE